MSEPKLIPLAQLVALRATYAAMLPSPERNDIFLLLDHVEAQRVAYERAVVLIDESAQQHTSAVQARADLGQLLLDTTEHSGACHLCGRPGDSFTSHDECPVGQYVKEHG